MSCLVPRTFRWRGPAPSRLKTRRAIPFPLAALLLPAFMALAPGAFSQELGPPSSLAVVSILRPGASYRTSGLRADGDALVPLHKLLPLGVEPRYEPRHGVVELRAPGWSLVGRLNSRQVRVNGQPLSLPVAPRLQKVRRSPSGEAVSLPLLPVVAVAKSLGYETEYLPMLGDLGPAFVLRAPKVDARVKELPPLHDFRRQQVVSPRRECAGELQFELARLDIAETRIASARGAPAYTVSVSLEIANGGKLGYVASDEYLFLEMADRRVLAGEHASKSFTARDLSVPVPAGRTGILHGGPWLFRVDARVPIRRVVYMDGVRLLQWRVEESEESPKRRAPAARQGRGHAAQACNRDRAASIQARASSAGTPSSARG